MSQTLLYDAKIQENFLKAVRFYEKAPTFLILNMKIKESVFNSLDHIRIVAFNKKDFVSTFKNKNDSSNNYDTKDFLKFSSNNNQNKLIDYYSRNFGFGFYNSYQNINKTSSLNNSIIDIDKKDIYLEKSNLYSLFITVKDTYELLEKEKNSQENSVYFKVYIKDKNRNVIWTSTIVTSPIKINDLITNASINNEFKYLKYFIKNDLQSAFLSITDHPGEKFLKINFPSGVANESINNITGKRLSRNSKNDIVGLFGTYYDNSLDNKIVDKSKKIVVDLGCKYNDIKLIERFSLTPVKQASLYNFDRQFVQFKLANVYEQIIENYYGNQDYFHFNLSLNVSIDDNTSYTLPDHVVSIRNNDDLINGVLENFGQRFIENKKSLLEEIEISYKNINTRIVQHKIDISKVKDKLTQIKLSTIKDSFTNKDAIYLTSDSRVVNNTLQISAIENLFDLKNRILEIEDGDKLVFYTVTLSDEISDNEKFVYTFIYYIENNFETSQDILGKQTFNNDLDKINYINKTVEINKAFKDSLTFVIDKTNLNLNLSNEDSMILSPIELSLSIVDRFNNLSNFFGYETVKEFLGACFVRFNYVIKISKNNLTFRQDENYLNTGTVGYFEKFYNFNELFRLNDSDEITSNDNIVSNLSFHRDIKDSSFNDFTQIKRSGIFDFIFSDIDPKSLSFKFHQFNNPRSSIILSYDMTLYPIPSLLNKYKNKGLDNIKNVSNCFNNELEAESVDRLFYDYIYNENFNVSFSSYIKIKESFFDPNVSLDNFFSFISKNMIEKNKLTPLDFVKLSNRSFEPLIIDNTDEVENNDIYNRVKAEFYVDRMFGRNLRLQGFPFIQNAIVKSKSRSDAYNIIYDIPGILKFDFDIVKSIKRINSTNNIQNIGLRFVNSLNDSRTSFELRLALVPLVKLNDRTTLSFEEMLQIKGNSEYLDIINEGNTTLLKPNSRFYSRNEEYQTWNNLRFNNYSNYGEDSYALSLEDHSHVLTHTNYKNYFTDFFNEALTFNFVKLHDIRLNVALLITTPDIINNVGKNDYWCDYYQISLLSDAVIDYDIGMLDIIRFVKNS